MYKISDKYHSRVDINNNNVTIVFIQETPQYIKNIYENLNVAPTIKYTSPFQLSMTNKELRAFIFMMTKQLLRQLFKSIKIGGMACQAWSVYDKY